MTVGDIRAAIKDLPDDALPLLMMQRMPGSNGNAHVELKSAERREGRLVLYLDITVFDDEFDDNDEEDDDDFYDQEEHEDDFYDQEEHEDDFYDED